MTVRQQRESREPVHMWQRKSGSTKNSIGREGGEEHSYIRNFRIRIACWSFISNCAGKALTRFSYEWARFAPLFPQGKSIASSTSLSELPDARKTSERDIDAQLEREREREMAKGTEDEIRFWFNSIDVRHRTRRYSWHTEWGSHSIRACIVFIFKQVRSSRNTPRVSYSLVHRFHRNVIHKTNRNFFIFIKISREYTKTSLNHLHISSTEDTIIKATNEIL